MESGIANPARPLDGLPGSPMNKRINLAEAFTWPLLMISIKPEVKISGLYVCLEEIVSFLIAEETSCAMTRQGHNQNNIGKRGFTSIVQRINYLVLYKRIHHCCYFT